MKQRLKQLAARPLAAAYLLAVLLWLLFAGYLNGAVWLLNR